MKFFVMIALILATASTWAAPTPLFTKGDETFALKTKDGKTPSFRVLNKTTGEKALALAVIATLNLQPEVKPKLPATEYVDLKIEELSFSPVKDKNELRLTTKLNGRYLAIPKPVDRTKFLAGEVLDFTFPMAERDVALFNVNSDGKLKMKLNTVKNELEILDAMGHIAYSAPFLGSGEETVRFSGIGTRIVE